MRQEREPISGRTPTNPDKKPKQYDIAFISSGTSVILTSRFTGDPHIELGLFGSGLGLVAVGLICLIRERAKNR